MPSRPNPTAPASADSPRVVLVGTYKGNQLSRWRGWYNYPLSADDGISEADAAKINELWLFQGTKAQKTYKAEFVGVKTRAELVRDYGYPATGKAHGDKYLLFKTIFLYRHKLAQPEEAERVIVRTKDFATSPKVRKQLKAYLESTDRDNPDFAKLLPGIVTSLPPERLRVCEAVYQMSFWDWSVLEPVLRKASAERIVRQEGNLCAPIAEYSRNAAAQLRRATASGKTAPIRVLELFAGVGGFRIGLERASTRFETVWNNQWEPATKRQDASIVYQNRFGIAGHSNEDISTVPVSQIPEGDLLVGGFPCQDYSVANTLKRAGGIAGKKGVLWWQIHRILRDSPKPPPFLFLENVDRLLKSPASQRGRDFAIILASLADLGYAMEWRVINAADYGMPQRRRRTYMVAYREGTRLAAEAAETTRTNAESWLLERGVIAEAFDARPEEGARVESFRLEGDLAEITKKFNAHAGKTGESPFRNAGVMVGRQVWTEALTSTYEGPRITLGELLVDEAEVPEAFFIDGEALGEWEYLKGPKSEMRKTPEGFEYHYTEGGMAFPDPLDKPSRTIITGEGGVSPSRFKHVVLTPSGRYRRLMPLELERLNMFPDNHTKEASDGRRAFLMGNALVTGIIERVGLVLKERM